MTKEQYDLTTLTAKSVGNNLGKSISKSISNNISKSISKHISRSNNQQNKTSQISFAAEVEACPPRRYRACDTYVTHIHT